MSFLLGHLKSRAQDELESALTRAFRLLMEALVLHAIQVDEQDLILFRNYLRLLDQQLGDRPAADTVMLVAGSAIKSLQDYNRGIERHLKGQSHELQAIISLLTRTVTQLAHSSRESMDNMLDIEHQLEQAVELADIRELRVKLEQCLKQVRLESLRHQQSTNSILEEVRAEAPAVTISAAVKEDTVTGLPGPPLAEAFIRRAIETDSGQFLALFKIDRVDQINNKYGYGAGDQILQLCARILTEKMAPKDSLFRWRGPCFLAILERNAHVEFVQSEMNRIASQRTEHTLRIDNRTVLLPVRIHVLALRLGADTPFDAVLERLIEFQSAQQ
jgi:diguanylate cyclase (GGDEF)-like protein